MVTKKNTTPLKVRASKALVFIFIKHAESQLFESLDVLEQKQLNSISDHKVNIQESPDISKVKTKSLMFS